MCVAYAQYLVRLRLREVIPKLINTVDPPTLVVRNATAPHFDDENRQNINSEAPIKDMA